MLQSRLSRYCQDLRTGAPTAITQLMIGTDRVSEPRYAEPKALPFQGAADSDPNSSAARRDLARTGFSFDQPRVGLARWKIALAFIVVIIAIATIWSILG